MEGYLEELLLLCQRSEEYAQFVLAAMAAAAAPAPLGAARENAFRSSPFSLLVRELVAYYINLARPPPRGTPVTTRRLHDTEALRRLAAGSRHSMRHMCPSRRTPGYIHGTPRLPEP